MPYDIIITVMLSKRKNLTPVLIAIIGGIVSYDAVAKLQPMPFQKTMQDVAQEDKNTIKSIGHEPFRDSRAYTQILIKEAEEFYQQAVAQKNYDKEHLPHEMYCQRYPGAEPDCPPIEEQPQQSAPPAPADGTPVGYDEFGRPVYASKTSHNGPCTLPTRDSNFTNTLINTGAWAESDPAFEKAASGTLRVEGGFAPFSHARGGDTKYGITRRYNPDVDIENLTPGGAQEIMHERYYLQQNINKLPDYVRGTFFDMHFMNPQNAWSSLCERLGVRYQTTITDDIAQKAKEYSGDLNNDLLNDYQDFFNVAAQQGSDGPTLLRGWTNRVNLMRTNGCHYPTEPANALRRPNSPENNG